MLWGEHGRREGGAGKGREGEFREKIVPLSISETLVTFCCEVRNVCIIYVQYPFVMWVHENGFTAGISHATVGVHKTIYQV